MNTDNDSHHHHALADTPLDHIVRIVAVGEPGSLGERLLEMGLTPGTAVRVVRRGLFGDPMQLALRGTMLSIRRAQANHITVAGLTASPQPAR